MPSASSTPETEREPHWRQDSKLDELLELARELKARADQPAPLVMAPGYRLVMFPHLRRGLMPPEGLYLQNWRTSLGGGPYPLSVEVMPQGSNGLGIRWQLGNEYSPLVVWEICAE